MQARVTRKPPQRVAPNPPSVEEVLDGSAPELNAAWITAVRAAEEKQALDIRVLDLRGLTSVSDLFVICHGRNPRQIQAIADEVEKRLKEENGERPIAVEGLSNAEWVLMDYGDFVVHVFSENARGYYDLERLYRDAKRLTAEPAPAPH